MENLEKKVAFITGGTKGIGFGIANALMNEGINVVITGRTANTAEKAAEELNSLHKNAKAKGVEANVQNFDEQQKAVNEAIKAFGKVDIVIANAGVGNFAAVEELTLDEWRETIETNLNGPFFTLKASLDELKKNKGYYITISSLAGTNFFKGGSAYNASKFGVTGFTQAAMLDLRELGIKASTIMPGSVSTYFNGNEPEKGNEDWKIQIEDIGQLVVDLLKMHPRTLPSKIEVRPTIPGK